MVETMDAVVGPIRASPANRKARGITVETTAIAAAQPTPRPRVRSPSASAARVKVTKAPVQTMAATARGEAPATVRSAVRM